MPMKRREKREAIKPPSSPVAGRAASPCFWCSAPSDRVLRPLCSASRLLRTCAHMCQCWHISGCAARTHVRPAHPAPCLPCSQVGTVNDGQVRIEGARREHGYRQREARAVSNKYVTVRAMTKRGILPASVPPRWPPMYSEPSCCLGGPEACPAPTVRLRACTQNPVRQLPQLAWLGREDWTA